MVFPNSSLKWQNQLHTGRYVKYNMTCKSVAGYSAVKPMIPTYKRIDSVIMMYKVVYNLVHRPLSSSVQQVLKPHAKFSSSNFGLKPLICMSLKKNSVHCILTRS